MATENPFVKLFSIDFKDHVEVKKSGNTELKYVSWAYAWAEVKKLYPSASYEVKKFNGLPYVYDPITGFMVYTSVTIEGVSHEMWLPVLDGANKAMKAVPYTYTTPKWEYNQQTRRREKVGMEERTVEQSSHKTVFAKAPEMGKIWRDFGHAFSFASSSSRGMYPSPSYLIWMCCTRFPLDLFGAST